MLDAYREHVAERAAQNIPPAPLSPEQVAGVSRADSSATGGRRRLSHENCDGTGPTGRR